MDMKLEVLVVPVSGVDRAKRFYEKLGLRLEIDYAANEDYRAIQFTPPSSTKRHFPDRDYWPGIVSEWQSGRNYHRIQSSPFRGIDVFCGEEKRG